MLRRHKDSKSPDAQTTEPAQAQPENDKSTSVLERLRRVAQAYWQHKKLALPLTLVVILLVVLALPLTRYPVLAVAVKRPFTIKLVDSQTNTPVSGASVTLGSKTVLTNNEGKAGFVAKVGNQTLIVEKKYYKSADQKVFVGISKSHNTASVKFVATGRLVPLQVVNAINQKPVANAEVKALGAEVKTDKNGKAIIVLPPTSPTQTATITASGYNDLKATLQISSNAANVLKLVPAGYVYFLSNLSGKIDVVKTHLDGSGRQTVLAGTGYETPYGTTLLASRDWKYLALLAQRGKSGSPELDLIDTASDSLSNIDEGSATFTPVGWDGDHFIYQVDRTTLPAGQNGRQALKSFDATSKKITVLAQTTVNVNSNPTSYGQQYCEQNFGQTYILGSKVVYTLNWTYNSGGGYWPYTFPCIDGSSSVQAKSATLNSVGADGSSNTVVKGFSYSGGPGLLHYDLSIGTAPYDGPNNLAISFYNGSQTSYFEYQNGQVAPATDITDQNFFSANYPTYLQSPSGNQVFWSEVRDGKNTLFTGDSNAGNKQQVASLSDYSPYGWFTNNYLLVSKNGSELYILPVNGGTPVRISDYYKPAQSFRGYGGGYGGL